MESFKYDADGNETQVQEPTGGSVTSPAILTYNYYSDGLRKSIDVASSGLNQTSLFTYSYRTDGKLEQQQINDNADSLVGNSALAFSYSSAGRLTQRTESGPIANSSPLKFYYNIGGPGSNGQMTTASFPEASLSGIQYDAQGALLGYTATIAGGSTYTRAYKYTLRGELAPSTCKTTSGQSSGFANGVLLACAAATSVSGWDARMGVVTSSGGGNYVGATDPSQEYYDAAGRQLSEDVNGGSSVAPTTATNGRSYDAENRLIEYTQSNADGASGNNDYRVTTAYQWGPNGHPIRIGSTPVVNNWSTQPTIAQVSYDTLHWDGASLLFTTNAQGQVDDIKVGDIGDITPLDPTYKGLTLYDRFAGHVAFCHNATGAGGGDLLIPGHTIPASKYGKTMYVSECGGGSMTTPSSIMWWGDYQLSSTTFKGVGQGGILGMPRPDGIADGFNIIQGVRTYDPNNGVWTTPDVYAGNVQDPMTQKSYMWNENNPVSYLDPTGYNAGLDMYEAALSYESVMPGASPLVARVEKREIASAAPGPAGEANSAIPTTMEVIASVDAAAARTMADTASGLEPASAFWEVLTGWTNEQASERGYNFIATTDGTSMTVASPEMRMNVRGGARAIAISGTDLVHHSNYEQYFTNTTLDRLPYFQEMHKISGRGWTRLLPYIGPEAGGVFQDNNSEKP